MSLNESIVDAIGYMLNASRMLPESIRDVFVHNYANGFIPSGPNAGCMPGWVSSHMGALGWACPSWVSSHMRCISPALCCMPILGVKSEAVYFAAAVLLPLGWVSTHMRCPSAGCPPLGVNSQGCPSAGKNTAFFWLVNKSPCLFFPRK